MDNATVKKSVADQVKDLENEVDRLKAELISTHNKLWEKSDQIAKLQGALSQNTRLLEENRELRRAVETWRRAVRFEQSAKKHKGAIRHVPVWNGTHRAKPKSFDYPGQKPITNAERVYLRRWMNENRRRPGLNGGAGALELILSNVPNAGPCEISQRDATVAATVITWLGTNCGRGFVMECEREIQKLKGKDAR